MKKAALIISLFLTVAICGDTYSGDDKMYYHLARKAVRQGDLDFGFMHFRSILNHHPRSRYRDEALFANGEYYFMIPKYKEAEELFRQYLELTTDENGKMFALAYLLHIATVRNNQEQIDAWRQSLLNERRQSFVFTKNREYVFRSPLRRTYKAVFDIEKIEFFIEGELFAKVYY